MSDWKDVLSGPNQKFDTAPLYAVCTQKVTVALEYSGNECENQP